MPRKWDTRRAGGPGAGPVAHQGGTVGLFVSILTRYPEVASVTYKGETHCLRLTFIVRSALPGERVRELKDLLAKAVTGYAWLARQEVRWFELEAVVRQGVSVLELWRDLDSLTQDELSLILTLTAEFLGEDLVVDQVPAVDGDDLVAQDELIAEMLEDLRSTRTQPNLIAFREEGRVLVFNQ